MRVFNFYHEKSPGDSSILDSRRIVLTRATVEALFFLASQLFVQEKKAHSVRLELAKSALRGSYHR